MIIYMTLENHITEWETRKFQASMSDLKPSLNYVVFSEPKITLVTMGDEHSGSRHKNEKNHRENIQWCLDSGAYVIGMGDHLETATRDSVGAGIYEQEEIIDQQLEHFYDLYRKLAEKKLLLGIHPGNHEERLYKSSGLNITKIMAKELGVKYFGIGKLHKFKVGNEMYTLYTTHGSSGARMAHTKIASALKLADMVEAEIYCMGHLHQLSHHVRNYYKTNPRTNVVTEGQKHFILTGSYLNHWGSYAHVMNLEPSRIGSPKIKLHGDQHLIRVSLG